jgi:hypothetical protein
MRKEKAHQMVLPSADQNSGIFCLSRWRLERIQQIRRGGL